VPGVGPFGEGRSDQPGQHGPKKCPAALRPGRRVHLQRQAAALELRHAEHRRAVRHPGGQGLGLGPVRHRPRPRRGLGQPVPEGWALRPECGDRGERLADLLGLDALQHRVQFDHHGREHRAPAVRYAPVAVAGTVRQTADHGPTHSPVWVPRVREGQGPAPGECRHGPDHLHSCRLNGTRRSRRIFTCSPAPLVPRSAGRRPVQPGLDVAGRQHGRQRRPQEASVFQGFRRLRTSRTAEPSQGIQQDHLQHRGSW
jgi:hypothetical protein